MSSPIEFRSYVRLATVEDWANGLQAARLPVIRDGQKVIGPDGNVVTAMYISVGLQYRYEGKVFIDGQKALEWSPWITIPIAKEGDTDAPSGQS